MIRKQLFSLLIISVILGSVGYSVVGVVPSSRNSSLSNLSNAGETGTGSNTGSMGLPNQSRGVEACSAWQEFAAQNPGLSIPLILGRQSPSDMASWWKLNSYTDGENVRVIIGARGVGSLDSSRLNEMVTRYGGIVVSSISLYGRITAIVVELPLTSVSGFAEEAYLLGLIGYAEPDMKIQATFVPNDPSWNLQWGPQKIHADWAWNTTRGDHSLLVAVVDTGIDYNHPDIAPNYVAIGYNWVSNIRDPMDDNGHGTHCTGIIAAVTNNSVGIAGIAQVHVMSEKVLDSSGSGYWDWVANGIINATDCGAKIISMSLGGSGDSQLVHDAIKYAYAHGVLVIAAAGNSNSNQLFYPAGYDEVISVAATDQNDSKAYFSNWGNKIELAAPGVNIYSTVPSGYEYMSGTSMACPHVSGVAALAWCRFANRSRDWIRLWLRYTADDLGAPGWDPYYGYGRIDARNAVEQVPPAHELILTNVEKPRYVEPGENVIFNASVLNFGSQNENNIQVQLLVNSSIVETETISFLGNCSSTEIGLPWSPTIRATDNVTVYVVPVSGEVNTSNNAETMIIKVRVPLGFVLIDQSHYNYPSVYYDILEANLTNRGYIVDTLAKSPITYSMLQGYNVFMIQDAGTPYTQDEVSGIETYVLTGGSILVMGDYQPSWFEALTSFAGIDWNNTQSYFYGSTTDIVHHPVTNGVSIVYFGSTELELLVRSPATSLIMRGNGQSNVLLAVSQAGVGRVACVAGIDFAADWGILQADNMKLCNNMIDWLSNGTRYLHQVVVYLDAPPYLAPSSSRELNATVYNVGLSSETNLELQIQINGTTVQDVMIPKLINGTSFTTSYLWTPSALGWYNVTAYAPPFVGENMTAWDTMTKLVHVEYPLIQPKTGQYASYVIDEYDTSSGAVLMSFYINFTYDHYVRPDLVYVNVLERSPDGFTYYAYSIVNIFTRYVEDGAWSGYYYPWWIQTGVTLHSSVMLLDTTLKINGSEYVLYGLRPVDCWDLPYQGYYEFSYDKAQGLMLRLSIVIGGIGEVMRLLDTNVPLNTVYSHELGVSLEAPQALLLGRSASLNATVYNLGQNNESAVVLSLSVDGVMVDSVTIPELLNGTSSTITYVWSPTQKGSHTILVQVPPVYDETCLTNNEVASVTTVFFYVRVYRPNEWMSSGTYIGGMGSDFSINYYLPYPIRFCGLNFYSMWISSNGLITFMSYDPSYNNSVSMLSTRFAIAPAWFHWSVPASGGIYLWWDDSSIVVRWSVASYYDSSVAANFEVVIKRSGMIRFDYGLCAGSFCATVGISDGSGFILAENKTDLNLAKTVVFTDDVTPPATITDLVAMDATDTSIILTFTAPGNDGNLGRASGYITKYSTIGPITEANWDQATTFYWSPIPQPAGSIEMFTVYGLDKGTVYWFAVEAYDDVPWYGGVSNSPSGVTTDRLPPASIRDLTVTNVTSSSVTLAWTAVGDDGFVGRATGYIIKYSTSGPISFWSWNGATTYNQSWIPQDSGSIEIYSVTGLQSNTTYWFAISAYDRAMNCGLTSNSPSARTLAGPVAHMNIGLAIMLSIAAVSLMMVFTGVVVVIDRRRSPRRTR